MSFDVSTPRLWAVMIGLCLLFTPSMSGAGRVVVWRREKNSNQQIAETKLPTPPTLLYLRMRVRDGASYNFDISANGREWKTIGENARGEHLPPWDRGVRVALTSGGAANAAAKFDWFRMNAEPEKSLARSNNKGKQN